MKDPKDPGPPSATTPEWMAVARRQAAQRRPAVLLSQWLRDGYVAPSPIDARTLVELDALALSAAPGFDALVLSPVAPLGVCSVLAPTSQDRTLSANRGTEVVSDPTNVLALEAAVRLRSGSREVRLASIHQVMRCQPVPKSTGFTRHFRMLALLTGGYAEADDGFEVAAVHEQVEVMLRLCDRASERGYTIGVRELLVRTDPAHDVMGDRVAAALQGFGVVVRRDRLESAYYDGLRVGLYGQIADGTEAINLGDIARCNWLAQLVPHGRARMIASGFGLQLLPLLFGKE